MSKKPALFDCRPLLIVLLIALAGLTDVPLLRATPTNNFYQPTWASVDQHNPAPEWFQDAKFGMYFTWGAFSVPAYENEWYPRDMYKISDAAYPYHVATYGDPFGTSQTVPFFPYNYFLDGHTNLAGQFVQFAPKLVSQGGNFDPDAWAQLFVNAGAKFAGPLTEHHDGYSMWASQVNPWNSVSKGPHLDLASLFAAAIRAKGLKFIVTMHHAYNFNGYYQYVPAQTDTNLQQLFGQLPTAQENTLWFQRLKELIDNYQPDLIWQDFDLNKVQEAQRLNFLAYYYNSALDWNKEVLATYKDGFDNLGEIYDYERGGPTTITSPYWLTDDSISSSTWGYVNGMAYFNTNALIDALIDRVSKNGNSLLSIAPMPDGTIPQAQQNILLGIGDWLGRFGEAIYSTRAWVVFGEGPTKMGAGVGFQTTPVAGTSADIRFTRNKATNTLYAIVMGWPASQFNITTLNSAAIDLTTLTNVQLLGNTAGTYINLNAYTQDMTGLHITPPVQPYTATAYVIKLMFSGQIPQLVTGSMPPSLVKVGTGTFTLTSANTYTAPTTILGGTLALGAGGSIANSPAITISAGAVFDVSGTIGGALTLAAGQTLSGAGAVNGSFNVGSGAILSPGSPVGTLTFSNSLTLTAGSTNIFAIGKSPLTNDAVDVGGTLTAGGTLIVTNIGTNALVAGDSFKLLTAGSYAGSFNSLTLPALASSLYWDASGLGANGTIRVAARNPPVIGNVGVSAGGLVVNGTSGITNGTYYVLTSTNLAMPLANWTRLLTNQFDAAGGFNFTNAMNPNSTQCYYLLQVP